MKRAGYYLIDIARCGKNYHLGLDRWRDYQHNQTYVDREWNTPFYTKDFYEFDDISSAADYIVTRYSLYGLLYAGRNKKGLRKMIPKPYYLEVKNRTLIEPR